MMDQMADRLGHSESGDCTVMAWLTSGKSHDNEERIAEMAESDCLVVVKLCAVALVSIAIDILARIMLQDFKPVASLRI